MGGCSICHGECFSRAGGLPCWLALVSASRGRFPEGESSLVDDFSSRAFRFFLPLPPRLRGPRAQPTEDAVSTTSAVEATSHGQAPVCSSTFLIVPFGRANARSLTDYEVLFALRRFAFADWSSRACITRIHVP